VRREEPFVDLYEALQVSPNADSDTIERVFRHLAKRYHPDNSQTGDADRFDQLAKAHKVLMDAEARAAYDAKYQEAWTEHWQVAEEAAKESADGFESDQTLRDRLMSLLYVQRRRNFSNPGIGNQELERLLGHPWEHLEFHFWYLRQKGWIEKTDRGFYAITVSGVDQVEEAGLRLRRDRLLAARAHHTEDRDDGPLQITKDASNDS
jgi:curved DNA-binding protein CbpA